MAHVALQPRLDREADAVAHPHLGDIGALHRFQHLAVGDLVVEGEQFRHAAGKGVQRAVGGNAGIPGAGVERLLRPAVEGGVRQRRLEQRQAVGIAIIGAVLSHGL